MNASPTMLAEAQTNLRDTNIALLHGSAENVWEIVDGDFDAITMGGVVQYLTSYEIVAFVLRAGKRLKPGGRIAIFDIIHSRKAVLRMMGLGRHKEVPSGFEIVPRSGGLRAVGRLAPDRQGKDFPSRRAYVRARVLRCHRQGKRDEDRYADVDVLRLSVSCAYETCALAKFLSLSDRHQSVHVVPPSVLI